LLECKLLESILAKTQFNKTLPRCCPSLTENEAENSLIFSQLKTKQNSSSNRSNKNNASNTLLLVKIESSQIYMELAWFSRTIWILTDKRVFWKVCYY
jgi:hypothetical protein